MRATKLNERERATILIDHGKMISNEYSNGQNTVTVESFGHTYIIQNAFGRKPKITQVKEQDQ